MSELRIAANLIDFTSYGHLQIVYVNGSTQMEMEVQAPINGNGGSSSDKWKL